MKKWTNILLASTLLISAGATLAEENEWEGLQLAPGVTLGILAEVEATYEKIGDEETTDANVATFEAALEAQPIEGVRGIAALFWEEGDADSLDVDAAYIELGGVEACPLTVSADASPVHLASPKCFAGRPDACCDAPTVSRFFPRIGPA